MINGIKLKDSNLSPNQRRIRLMELSGITISEREKKRLLNESVSMVEIPKNRTQVVPNKPHHQQEDELDLDEVLREMWYYEESDDLRDDFTDEVEDDDTISNMSREELKTMIQMIVLDTMEEEDDLNEIIENLTKNY
tara:strand:+ start:512 stop:922 length:411 start_codon:yes stop_codon:yes gene_type:complete